MPHLYPLGSIFFFLPFGNLLQNGFDTILVYKIEIAIFLVFAHICVYFSSKFLKEDCRDDKIRDFLLRRKYTLGDWHALLQSLVTRLPSDAFSTLKQWFFWMENDVFNKSHQTVAKVLSKHCST
jgi:hypothetical protein